MGEGIVFMAVQGNMRDPLEEVNVLYHDYINVSILVVKLCNSFVRC